MVTAVASNMILEGEDNLISLWRWKEFHSGEQGVLMRVSSVGRSDCIDCKMNAWRRYRYGITWKVGNQFTFLEAISTLPVHNNQLATQCKPIISKIHGRWLSLKASTCQKINIENTLFAFQGTVSYFENRVSITHCLEGLLDMTSAQ